MSPQDNKLDSALSRLREASNPNAGEKARIFSALKGLSGEHANSANGAEAGLTLVRLASTLRERSVAVLAPRRSPLVWGFSAGLAMFALGFALGRGSDPQPPPLPSVGRAPLAFHEAPAALVAPIQAWQASPLVTRPAESEPDPAALPERTPRVLKIERNPRPRARSHVARSKTPQGQLTLADALRLLHRAERAIHLGRATWALSLLDELDERAPKAMLGEERIATRVLALCRDGQIANAEHLADEARREAPGSIYGSLLERGCNPAREGAVITSPLSTQSTTP